MPSRSGHGPFLTYSVPTPKNGRAHGPDTRHAGPGHQRARKPGDCAPLTYSKTTGPTCSPPSSPTAADHDQRDNARAEELQRQISQNETAQHGLITQLERLGNDTSPAADAMRQRITDQFTARYDEARTLQAELDQMAAAQPAEDDPALLDELPYAATAFTAAPEDIKAKIYAAFDIQVLYRAPIKQATIWATITPTTPAIITARPPTPAPTTTPRMET